MPNILDDIKKITDLAIQEDLGTGDITSQLTINHGQACTGDIIAKDDGRISGLLVLDYILKTHTSIQYQFHKKDGDTVKKSESVVTLKGSTIEILSYERTILNFLQHLSGIATTTSKFVEKATPYGCKILDTRKTLPGLRRLEKKAVLDGGGTNHRMGLYDAVLIKENHIKSAGSITKAINLVISSDRYHKLKNNPTFFIQVEAETLEQVKEACNVYVNEILLDNMSLPLTEQAIEYIRKKSPTTSIEVSGNVSLENVVTIAKLKPDRISIGKITHSAPVLDLSLLLDNILIV